MIAPLSSVRVSSTWGRKELKWRPASAPVPRPSLWSREGAITEIEKQLRRYVITEYAPWIQARQTYLRDLREWREYKNGPRPGRPEPPGPLAIQGTTGLGKSATMSVLRDLCTQLRIPTLALCANHQLVTESYGKWFHYHGRAPIEAAARPWDCQQYGAVMRLTRQNHFPQSVFCVHHCPNGRRWVLDVASENTKRHQNAQRWFQERRIDPNTVEPCRWQSHLRDGIRAFHTATVAAALSDALLIQTEILVSGGGAAEHDTDRLLVLDESAQVAKTVAVTMEQLSLWADEGRRRLAENSNTETRNSLEAALTIFAAVAQWLGGNATAERPDSVPMTLQSQVVEAALCRSLFEGETALWEQVRVDRIGEMSVPLRAARAIVETFKVAGGRVEKGRVSVVALTRVGEYMAAGLPAILLDATLPAEVAAIINLRRAAPVGDCDEAEAD